MSVNATITNNVTREHESRIPVTNAQTIEIKTARDFMTAADMAGNQIDPAAVMVVITDAEGQETTCTAAGAVIDLAGGGINREHYDRKRADLYKYQAEQAEHAAAAWIDACRRCFVNPDRLSVVQFLANTFPDIKAADAVIMAGRLILDGQAEGRR